MYKYNHLLNVWHFSRNTLAFLEQQGGGVCRFTLGPHKMCLVNQPNLIESIYLREANQFVKPRLITKLGATLFGDALTALDNQVWSSRRKLFAKAFTPTAIDTLISKSVKQLDNHYEYRQLKSHEDVENYYRKLFVELYGNIFAGIELQEASLSLSNDIGTALEAYGTRLKIGVNIPDWIPLGMNRRLTSSMASIRATLKPVILKRLNETVDPLSVIGVLKSALACDSVSVEHVLDELLVMITVGAHQSANAVAWLYYLLAKNPQYQLIIAKESVECRQESWASSNNEHFKITTACVNESLRLFPPFYIIGREAICDCVVDGHKFSKRENVLVSAWVTQRDPRYFESPDEFIPERWLEKNAISKFTYFPYGIGGRTCLAQLLLNRLLPVVVGRFLEKHSIQMSEDNEVVPKPGATLGLKSPLKLKVDKRAATANQHYEPASVL